MVLYWVVFFIIFYCALYDWKKTVLAWMSLCLLFNPVVCLRYQSPNLQLGFAVNSILFIIYMYNKQKIKNIYKGKYIFKGIFIAYLLSYSISSLFSVVPLLTVITHSLQFFMNSFVAVFLFHKALNDNDDIKFFLKINGFVVFFIFVLGLYEFVFKDNPWLDYVYMSCDDKELIFQKSSYKPSFLNASGELRSRYGMIRAYSFFEHPIRYGCACAMYISLYVWLYNKNKTIFSRNYHNLMMIILLLTGVVFCNSKTPFVGIPFFFLAAMPLNFFYSRKSIPFFFGLSLFGVIALSFSENIFDNFLALVNSDKMTEGGESTPELRLQQYAAGLSFWLQSPIWGNGAGSIDAMMTSGAKLQDIGGAESSWLQILPERGIIGVMSYLYLYYQMYQYLNRKNGKRFALFFLLGLMGMETATGVMDMFIYGVIIIVITRYRLFMNKSLLSKRIKKIQYES